MLKPEATTPDQILQIALAKERETRELYGSLAINCRVDSVRDLLERLQGEEAKHVHMVQDMITKLNLGRGFA